MIKMEVCANSVTSALAAQLGGAVRIELCASLSEGGTTPSYGEIRMATQLLDIEVFPIIRPRGGDFLYTDLEFELMQEDVKICKTLHCKGIVTGVLTAEGKVDKLRCKKLIELAYPMQVAFHRAFDMTENLDEALEDIISLGFVRILSSGGKASALQGAEKLAELIRLAAGRIEIMPGSGIHIKNIQDILQLTGAQVFHASARISVESEMAFQNDQLNMGAGSDEYSISQTSASSVKKLLELANSMK